MTNDSVSTGRKPYVMSIGSHRWPGPEPYASRTRAVREPYASRTRAVREPYESYAISIHELYTSYTRAIHELYNCLPNSARALYRVAPAAAGPACERGEVRDRRSPITSRQGARCGDEPDGAGAGAGECGGEGGGGGDHRAIQAAACAATNEAPRRVKTGITLGRVGRADRARRSTTPASGSPGFPGRCPRPRL
jgi:hypothetical protein